MKYFQNYTDTVRDLMSASGEEKFYTEGMHMDDDGFMDMEWCSAAALKSWDDLRHSYINANSRKAIAPTQARRSHDREMPVAVHLFLARSCSTIAK